jgi:FkbM family methyltransferase
MNNYEYIQAMSYNGLVAQRLKHLVNIMDFSKVKTILDIGSWHLNQSLEFMHIFPNAKVYAFEPNPVSANLCREKAASLPYPHSGRVSVIEVALTNVTGEITFYPLDTTRTNSTNHGMSSTLKLKDGMDGSWHNDKWVQKEIQVKADTLDSWCEKNGVIPDLLWVDVQGAEYTLYDGARNTIKNHVKAILTEVGIVPYYEGHTVKPDIDRLLKNELGMEEVESSFEMADPYEANTIYINKERVS